MRSESNPKFFRTASKNRWIRDNSKFGGRSGARSGSNFRSVSRPGSKPGERGKSELFRKVEKIEKENVKLKKTMVETKKAVDIQSICMKNMEELMKNIPINTKFVEEEIVVDVKYVEKDMKSMMVIDSGAPVSLVSSTWLKNYLKEFKVDNEEVERSGSNQRFRL